MRLMAHAGLVLGLWVALASAAPQRESESPPTISVETNLVILPVTVVDRHGAAVAGLTPQHFKVYDKGQLQDIEFFTNEDVPATIGLVIARQVSVVDGSTVSMAMTCSTNT